MFYEDVFKALNKARVKYVVAGGVAVVLYGFLRYTKDVDLIVHLEEKNLIRLFDALLKIGYHPKVPVTRDQFIDAKSRKKWQKEKGMIVFSFYHTNDPFKAIDMFIEEPIKFSSLYEKRTKVKAEGMIKFKDMTDDRYELDQKNYAVVGQNTKRHDSLRCPLR